MILAKKLFGLKGDIRRFIEEVGRYAQKNNFTAYLVGGFVRDLILKRDNLDVDIVVEVDAIKLARDFSKKKKIKAALHPQFKTATFFLGNGLRIDLATARKERYPQGGALPVVEPGVLRDDLYRRDFTINAMAVVINSARLGELVDYFGGFDDIQRKKIRILHDQSFWDDPTRILRAVRFEQRFNFTLEERTLRLLKIALKAGAASSVKPPRYFQEFKKILQEPQAPQKYIKRLQGLGALKFIDSVLYVSERIFGIFESIQENVLWFEKRFSNRRELDCWLIYFMPFFLNLSIRKTEAVLEKFNISRQDREKITASKNLKRDIKNLTRQNLKPSQIYKFLKPLSYENILFLRASASSALCKRRVDAFLLQLESIKPAITGEDLKRLGILPGQHMGRILNQVLCAKIDGAVRSYRDEVALVKQLT